MLKQATLDRALRARRALNEAKHEASAAVDACLDELELEIQGPPYPVPGCKCNACEKLRSKS